MNYLIFEDPITKTYYPVILCGHLDPYKVSIDGMKVSSGGSINLSPDARFSLNQSDLFRSDEQDDRFVGYALSGMSGSEFKKKVPVLLFKMIGDETARKAYTIQELIDLEGFPENVVWVSKMEGSPAFDKFFEVTPTGSVKAREVMNIPDIESYSASLSSGVVPGVVGSLGSGMDLQANKVNDIHLEMDFGSIKSPDRLYFKFDHSSGMVYWWLDTNDTATAILDRRLSSMGYKPSKHIIITKDGHDDVSGNKPKDSAELPSEVQDKKQKKKPKK